jgi:hypothetical protein
MPEISDQELARNAKAACISQGLPWSDSHVRVFEERSAFEFLGGAPKHSIVESGPGIESKGQSNTRAKVHRTTGKVGNVEHWPNGYPYDVKMTAAGARRL